MRESVEHARSTAEAIARRSYGKLVALLAARTSDVAGAEDALCEAFAAALVDWPSKGTPERPESWLLTVAERKMIDAARRRRSGRVAEAHLKLIAEEREAAAMSDQAVPDKRLLLMFACAHPALDPAIRGPLILQTVLGFDAATIASAFLVPPATMAQRLVRAKNKIRHAGILLRWPEREDLPERLGAVLEAIYAAFAEGWSDPTGVEARRRSLSDEAIWLGRLVVSLVPSEPEALGLLALMLYADARRDARRHESGRYVPFAEQDMGRWKSVLIEEAEALLLRASKMALIGRYQLEAAVQSAHVARRRHARSNWTAIVTLYDALLRLTGSPVVAVNRALAVAEAVGPREGLEALREVEAVTPLKQYQPYWAALAELHARLDEIEAASHAYRLAIDLEADTAVRLYLQGRLNRDAPPSSAGL